jgi:phosphomannomutase
MSVSPSQEPFPQFRGHQPTTLRFGTSGLRGLVTDITDLEAYVNTRGFLGYLFEIGEVESGKTVCVAGDLRPSSDSPERSIMRAVARAIEDAGLQVENLGKIPTPALTYYALQHDRASVMVTGSHIPFDRNGIKFNTRSGEVLKRDEAGILRAVDCVRREEYCRPPEQSIFDDKGMLKQGESHSLPPVNPRAAQEFIDRYVSFFGSGCLQDLRIVFFQHSAVGRDLFVELLQRLGAEVHAVERSDQFIPIDTEDISDDRLMDLQRMADNVALKHGAVDAVVSTDGDSDRPLLCGVEDDGAVRFYGGDLLGLMVAEYLEADSVSVPISANDAVDAQLTKRGIVVTKTRIGSPHVIKAMEESRAAGKGNCIVGWEANGGFLTGSVIQSQGRSLEPLPTRDAALPLIAALASSVEKGRSLIELFRQLPPRYSKAGLIDEFPQTASQEILRRFSPDDEQIRQVDYERDGVRLSFVDGRTEPAPERVAQRLQLMRQDLSTFFTNELGFDDIVRINTIDGVRVYFRGGDIAHVRPSGNAPQLRIYAVANSQERADEIVRTALREPDGILRCLEEAVT